MGSCPDAIYRLIEHFDHQRDQVRSLDYNETQLRIDFVNPMFRELGWDIDNALRYAAQYREVVHEDRVKVAGATKAPDYSFRIGGNRKFFLEAKKPAVNIKENWEPAYQLRRYAWSAKLAVSILTDFEELAIYDCRIQPKQLEKASVARREYITYTQYSEKWDFISSTFSKDAVLRGDFDRYCGSSRGRGAQEFDVAFLEEIEEWRKTLASNLALRNDSLDERSLNFAVQRIIDRIIFLRIAEDRGTETSGQLQSLLNGENTYARLGKVFRDADARYNSGLFHFGPEKGRDEPPDELTPSLDIADATLKQIIRRLYYPESPYEFTVVSADILGSVYERFLGKVITLTTGHRARIEEKPEVRKAGGVYYTPAYIVDYIVKNTLGKLLNPPPPPHILQTNITPKEASKLKILDPACGSGSFLIGAYQYLLDWHLEQYTAAPSDPQKLAAAKSPVLRPGPAGDWRLTIAERKRILLSNIHGVDLDPAAVEVTKLNLLLKCLEGETSQTLGFQQRLFRDRALPDLGHNILCGNSLIATDIMATDAWKEMSDEEKQRINPFDYERAFPQVFKQGGFDAVIGNPPYVRQEGLKPLKAYLESSFRSFAGQADLFVYFMERGIRLLKSGGIYSVIVSSSLLRATYAEALRSLTQNEFSVRSIVDFGGLAVFADAKDTYVCIPAVVPGVDDKPVSVSKVRVLPPPGERVFAVGAQYEIPRAQLTATAWSVDPPEHQRLLRRLIASGTPLGKFVEGKFFSGIKSGLNEAFVVADDIAQRFAQDARSAKFVHQFLGGEDIRHYYREPVKQWMIVVPCGWTRESMGVLTDVEEGEAWRHFAKSVPTIAKHLKLFEAALRERQDQGEFWWELRPCDYYSYFESPKIVFPDICKDPRFYLDEEGLYLTNTAYCLGTADKRLLAFLNSKLFWFLIAGISIPFGMRAGRYRYRLIYQYMEHVPIALKADQNDGVAAELGPLADSMLTLQRRIHRAVHPHEREQLQRQLDATGRQIDQVVYSVYGLCGPEIRIVQSQIHDGVADATS